MRYILTIVALMLGGAAQACGADSDCMVGDRSYRISLPEGVTEPVGAVIWSHGYRGSAKGVMRNGSLRKMVHGHGLALIAAQGVNGTWDLPNGPRTPNSTGAEEFAYFDAVIADAHSRFRIDSSRLVASGFSAGGMMVWNIACARPDMFAGFVPISGTYWLKPPTTCAQPIASIIHIHGDADKTVPLLGRPIGPTHQGEVPQSLAHYSDHGDFGPLTEITVGPLDCTRSANKTGAMLEFCLFKGGHSFRTEYLSYALDRLRDAGEL